jgi:hypothetical protein
MTAPSEPTAEQCSARERLDLGNGNVGYACWYPQMGGYVGKAVLIPEVEEDDGALDDGCFDVYVWHDGGFPFDADDPIRGGPPRRLHHCDPEQFITFGAFARSACTRVRREARG